MNELIKKQYRVEIPVGYVFTQKELTRLKSIAKKLEIPVRRLIAKVLSDYVKYNQKSS
jgi:alanine-alpha-ketoisovalerate/valine-pyruvate aminotransferase